MPECANVTFTLISLFVGQDLLNESEGALALEKERKFRPPLMGMASDLKFCTCRTSFGSLRINYGWAAINAPDFYGPEPIHLVGEGRFLFKGRH